MPFNQLKKYNALLEIVHLSPRERIESLKGVFTRDISDNPHFNFRKKIIRPLKKDGAEDMASLFEHLTCASEDQYDNKGRNFKSRSEFDFERSKRLHWIWFHIQEKNKQKIDVFSFPDRKRGKNVIRTYIYDESEKYVIILEPQRSGLDYYLLTAYYLTEDKGGIKQIEKKRKRRLNQVY